MSVFRYKGSKVWTMDFHIHGQRIRESTGTRSKTLAIDIARNRRRAIEEGLAGIRKRKQPGLLSIAAEEWHKRKKATWAPSTSVGERVNLDHLLPELGRKLIVDIEAKDVAQYQKKRLSDGASPKTVNNEVGTLRGIMQRSGTWARIKPEVSMLTANEDVGRAISAEEERALLEACSRSRSRSLLPFIVLTLETGARKNTVRTLQWRDIDFKGRCLRFGKDKTAAGTGRVIPLNQRALATLTFWAARFPDRKPEHYVFATEKYGLDGEKGYLNGQVVPYSVDPKKPMGSWKTAWNAARKLAGVILAGNPEKTDEVPPLACRLHDLRHSAISRMINAGVPLPKVAKIVGWAPSTMVKMAARYGHFTTDDLRGAMEAISSPVAAIIPEESPVFSPVSEEVSEKPTVN